MGVHNFRKKIPLDWLTSPIEVAVMAWLVPDRKQHDVYTPFPYRAVVDPGFWMSVRMEKLMRGCTHRAQRFVPTAVGP